MGYYDNPDYQDNTLKAHDVTWLFRMAQEWLITNPGEQINKIEWDLKGASELEASNGLPLAIFVAGIGIHAFSPEIIPALAAISMRRSREEVAEILAHHRVDYRQLTDIKYEFHDLSATQLASSLPTDIKNQVLDRYSVAHGIIQAFSCNKELKAMLIVQSNEIECSPAITFAKLHTEIPELWPITHIENAFKQLPFPVSADLPSAVYQDYTNVWPGLKYVGFPDDFPNDGYIDILDRSGALHLGASEHHYFTDDLFRRLLTDMPSGENRYNAQRFVDALCAEDRPEVLDRITKKMLSAMKGHNMDGLGWSKKMNTALDDTFPAGKFESVKNSISARLCLNDLSQLGVEQLRESIESPDQLFPWSKTKVSQVLLEAADEFMARPVQDLEYNDFKVMYRALSLGIKQDCDGPKLNQLMVHILNGADVFCAAFKDQPEGRHTSASTVRDITEAVVYRTLKRVEPDFELLNTVSSRAQSVLVSCGLDIKKFPHMNRSDRGRVLCSDLGL